MAQLKLAVIGGNGYVGSAVCRLAVSRGWQVLSFSRNGQPYTTPKGHRPAWTHQVDWRAADALDLSSLSASELAQCDAAVHTLGILLETDYKSGSLSELLSGLQLNPVDWARGGASPLDAGAQGEGKYEKINRDSAISVLNAFTSTPESTSRRPFVYLSAEDIFRPLIPSRYIETKRQAEQMIDNVAFSSPQALRPVFMRPSLIYHPHLRPISTLPATLIDLSATIQRYLPSVLQARTLAGLLPLQTPASLARLVSIPPVHLDTVAEAICKSIESPHVEGVVDVARMRRLVGFSEGVAGEDREVAAPGSL